MTDPKNFSVVTAFAQSTPKSVEPREELVEVEAQAVSNWPFNTVRAGPPTPPVYDDQQLNPGPVSFFPYPVRDPNNLPLTFSVVTPLPASLQINAATGEIYGTLDELDWDITTCQVQVSNGFFSVTGPVFRLYYYMTGGDVTKITVYGIEYNVHSFDYDSFQTGDQANFPVEVGRDVSYLEYLLIGGGGGGGTDRAGGGGGGGVVIGDSNAAIGSYFAVVGNGGAAGTAGSNSSFVGVTAVGGGYGGSSASTAVTLNAGGGPPSTGGSGGGGSTTGTIVTSITFGGGIGGSPVNYYVGAAGTAGQGNTGGNGPGIQAWASFGYDPGVYGGAGGGGAGGPGSSPATSQIGGVGGPGVFVKIDGGAGSYVGGGGAGGSWYNNAAGGSGGGGSFAGFPNGTDGTGGGGAGGRTGAGGRGGRGRVVLRYPLYPQPAGVRVFGLVQWLDAANYTSGNTWPDNFAGNNATLFNAPSKDAIDGGGCIVFNGTTQYARYNTPAELHALSSFTIETWVKWNTVGSTSSTIQTILDNSWPGSFILQDRPDLGGRLSFEYTQLSGTTNLTTSSKIGDGNWHHVAIVGDFRTPDVRIYVDSALAGVVSSPTSSNRVIKATTTIGRLDSSASRYLNGRMAILRNYTRPLPYADILNNFLTEVNRFGTAPEKAYGGVSQLTVIDNVSYIAHTFTSTSFLSGQASFTLSVLSPISAEYTVIGGGGGGGANGGGGGGAGGLRTGTLALSAGSYPVTIGAGGNGGTSFVAGGNGYNTSLASIVATGGGGGASRDGGNNAGSGGSGGGGAGAISASRAIGGTGTAGQGFNAGDGTANLDINSAGGGGGGSAAAGASAASLAGGAGGIGFISNISGIKGYLAGGGGGGAIQSGIAGSGGAGGGGSGSTTAATAGTATTGGGGGGGGTTGGAGGSGITIIRYPTGSVSPVIDPNAASAVALLPGLGYANSTLANWTDFSPTPRTYSPTNVVNFDGTGDYLTVPGTSNFAFGTGDYTVEGWFYATNSTTRVLYDARPFGGSGAYPTVYINPANQIVYYFSSADRLASYPVPANTWNHFAITRKGTTSALFINGFPTGLLTDSTNFLSGSPVVVGGNSNANSFHWSGSLSNFRVTKGVARYEPTYTQPASEFPDRVTTTAGDANYGNTVFLLRPTGPNENIVFSDRSSAAYNVTRNGTPVRSSLAPFSDTSSVSFGAATDYLSLLALPNTILDSSNNKVSFTNNGATMSALSPFVNTGSLSFNGSTAFVTTPDRTDWLFNGDFTIEAWVYPTSVLASGSSIVAHWTNGVATQCSFILYLYGANRLGFSWGIGAANVGFQGTSTTVPLNTWTHVAVTRSGSTVRLFVNGVLDATTGTATGALNDAAGDLQIGRVTAADGGYFAGNISNLRITKGVARYTSTFSVPSASFPASSDPNFASVGLLMLMESGVSQIVFPGDFTMETWVYLTATGPRSGTDDGYGGAAVFSCTSGGGAATIITYFNIGTYRATLNGPITAWAFTYNVTGTQPSPALVGSSAPQTNVWTHVAVTRSGTTLRLFVNGTLEATATVSGTIGNATYSPRIGSLDYTYTRNLQGYVSDTRVTKGVARYTSTFTRPTSSFPTSTAASASDPYYASNVLLLRGTGVTGGTSFVDFGPNALVPTVVGNAQTSTAQSKWGGSSMLFDGSGDRLSYAANSTLFGFGIDDFTIECWFYIAGNSPISGSGLRHGALCANLPTASTITGYTFLVLGNASTTGTGLIFETGVSGVFYQQQYTGTVTQGVWHHAAVSRRGTLTRLFLDGVCVLVATLGNQSVTAPHPLTVGGTQYTGYTYDFNGYIDDFRISKVARYTANFTPPQRYNTGGADPNFANVSLLLPLNEPIGVKTFVDASSNAVPVTTVGDTVAGTTSAGAWSRNAPKAYGGAVYFDGTANTVRTFEMAQALVTSDFTMEGWINSNSSSAINKIIFLGSDYGVTGRSSIGVVISGTELRVLRAISGTAATIMTTTGISTGGWNHVALVRSGTALYLFVNGTNTAVAYDATPYYDTNYTIGWYSAGNYFIGYMQDVRIYHGAAKYVSGDTDFGLVSLLLHGDGTNGSTTITNSAVSTLTATAQGNAQISTVQSKWGGSSIAFDGNADYLSLSTAISFAAAEDFTVECWVYKTAVDPSGYTVVFYGTGGTQFNFDAVNIGSIGLAINNTTVVASASSGTAVTSNAWHHLAWTRQGTTVRAFVNGVLMGSGTSSAAFSLSEIGRFGQTPFGYEMNGYIDDIRITKGLARYTANFAVPSAAFPDAPSFAPPAPLAT